jgi:ribosome-associated translation inhibitor RaiA
MIQVTFHGLDPSAAVTEAIERRARNLTRLAPQVTHVRVVIEVPHLRHRQGNRFHVRLDVVTPSGEIIVGRDAASRVADTDVYVGLRRVFEIAARRLTAERQRRAGRSRARAVMVEPAAG